MTLRMTSPINWNLITCQGVRIIIIAPLEFAIYVIVIPSHTLGASMSFLFICQ